jgi:hemoglobin
VTATARLAWLSPAAILIAACAAHGVAPASQTLYARLGGDPVMARVVDDLIERTASDPRTRRSFAGIKLARVKEKLREQVCELADGPCKYSGDPMQPVHGGLKITEAEFLSMVQLLREALERAGVGEGEKNELLRRLAPMKRDIVSG